jgi:hypothetical protein
MRSPGCVCVAVYPPYQLLNNGTNLYETMYTTAPEPISTAYFLTPSQQSLCPHVYHSVVVKQRLGKNITEATMEELLDAMFSMRFLSYQRKLGGQFFPQFLVILLRNTISVMIRFVMSKEMEGGVSRLFEGPGSAFTW